MKYFVERHETRVLDERAREGRRGEFARLGAGVTNFELSGPEHGELLVLTPGLTVPLDAWDVVVPALHDEGLRTLTYSAYGRGYSDRAVGPYEPSLFVRQLSELVQLAGAPRIHLVGSSMGALFSLAYLDVALTPVASLILSGPAGLATQPNPATRLPKNGPIAPLVGKHFLRRVLMQHMGRNVRTPEQAAQLEPVVLEGFAFEGSMYALLSTLMYFPIVGQEDLYDRAGLPGPPVLLLWGDSDEVTPPESFSRAVELLDPAESHLIEECGHMVPLEQPEMFVQRVASFVKEHSE